MIYKRSSTSPRLTFADERVVASTPTVSRQNSVARSVEENVSKVVPKVNPENPDLNTTDITDGIAKTRLADQDGATVNGAIHRYDIFWLLKWIRKQMQIQWPEKLLILIAKCK